MEHKDCIPLYEVRRFLSGLKSTANSKVFLRVEDIDGYHHLCVYLDNTYPEDDIVDINGFRKWYQLKMNKIEE